MLLEIINRELTSLLSWYRGAMYRSPDPLRLQNSAGNLQLSSIFKENKEKCNRNQKPIIPGDIQGTRYNIFDEYRFIKNRLFIETTDPF